MVGGVELSDHVSQLRLGTWPAVAIRCASAAGASAFTRASENTASRRLALLVVGSYLPATLIVTRPRHSAVQPSNPRLGDRTTSTVVVDVPRWLRTMLSGPLGSPCETVNVTPVAVTLLASNDTELRSVAVRTPWATTLDTPRSPGHGADPHEQGDHDPHCTTRSFLVRRPILLAELGPTPMRLMM